jgi:hypothetical protein
MGAMGNMKNNITPKARLMIGLTLVAVVSTVGITYMRLNSNNVAETAGVADLKMPPSKDQISKDKPTDVIKFGDNTAVGEIYKEDEARKAEAAQKSKESHVDDIRLQMKDTKPAEVVKPVAPEEGKSKLQELMDKRKKLQEQNGSEQMATRGKQVLAIQENPWKQFLDNEMRDANEYELSFQSKVAGIKSNDLHVPSPKFEESMIDPSKRGTAGLTQSGTTADPYANTGYGKYLSNSKSTSGQSSGTESEGSGQAGFGGKGAQNEKVESEYPSERIAKSAVNKPVNTGFVHVGETYFSVLQIGVNTDEISPIRAVSVDKGMLDGAVFVGNPARTGEKAVLNFTSMSLNGRSYKIQAIALDPDTYRSGIADGVDNHVFSRYSKLALASFVDGYSNALTGTQTVRNTDGSSSSITNPLPSASDQMKVGIGKVGEKMTPIFEREFDQPPTVTVEPNRSIVIMFMQEVDLNGQSSGPDLTKETTQKTK